ncbi:YetF domain-containing protein [Ammoniphilus sp. 3BR4]|uniref:YetF domain-containing protein n=1 Tax=Ammoniphilus sp. 3BR4 TaxID=3158265 RepID=UPI003467DE5E
MDFWQGDAHLTILSFVIRATVAYLFLFSIIKFLGQRTMSTLQAQDFLFAIVIGDVIGEPLVNGEVSLAGPLAVALTLTGIHYFTTLMALKSSKFRRFVDEEPRLLVSRGKILRNMMRRSKVTLDMLLMSARMNNVTRLSDVELAILEPNGEISIITKGQANPVTPKDLELPVSEVRMPSVLIEDGNVIYKNLKNHKLTEEWLLEQLQQQGINSPKEVFLALLEADGALYVSKQEEPYMR